MSKSDRKSVGVKALLPAGALLVGVFAVGTANAADDAQAKGASCQQETRRVVTWPAGSPKSNQFGRVENHIVTICDGKVVSSKPERNAASAAPAGNREGG